MHFIDSTDSKSQGTAIARSQNPKVLELAADRSTEQRYQGLAPGVAEILFSPPINIPGLCLSGYGGTIATPCVVATVTVTKSCASKSAGNCKSPKNTGTTVSKVSNSPTSLSAAAPKAEQSPLAVLCTPGFFTKAQAQLLVQQFGFIECFRFTGESMWVIIGNGMSQQASSGPTMGGSVIAMEKCDSSDSTCLDPSTVHNFANFTVYYPPDPPGDFLGTLTATSYGNLLSLESLNQCPPAIFDMTSGHWYPKNTNQQALETNPGSIQSLKAPVPVRGARALAQTAAPGKAAAC
ncbi:MAG: hypothetical protein EPN30_00350 [Actinomycetota bacterium]|nr:MAG: hypothetical protein EPN30_00350 [Actinomycetota bacterium]